MKKLIAVKHGPAQPANSVKTWPLVHTRWTDGVVAALVVWAVLTIQPVLAINRYQGIPLPDAIRGSTALSLTKVGAGNTEFGVVGSQQNTDGTTGAMYWGIAVDPSDPTGNTVSASELPKPSSASAVATGIAFLDGDPHRAIVAGNFIGTDATGTAFHEVAVLWRQDAMGQFQSTVLDDEAVQSQANAIVSRDTPLGLIIVVCGKFQLPNGDWHACVWTINWGDGAVERTDLGTLGGPNSEAMAIANIDDLIGWNVVGSAQGPGGRTLATAWVVHLTGAGGLDWFLRALPTPPGTQSSAVFVSGASGGIWKTTGSVRGSDGRTSACIWINQGETPATFVSQVHLDVLGRKGNSVANGVVGDWNGDGSVDGRDLVIGTARNARGIQRGVAALPFLMTVEDVFSLVALASKDPVLEWNDVALNVISADGAIAGQGLVNGSTTPQAMLFLPTREEVPQIIAVLIGFSDDTDLVQTWQEDGNAMRLRPRHEGQVQSILAEWTSGRSFTSGHATMGGAVNGAAARAPRKLTLVSRIRPLHANPEATLTLTLQLYDPKTEQWVPVENRVLTASTYGRGTFFREEFDIANPEPFAVDGADLMVWRVGLQGEEWKAWEVDFMKMDTEQLP